MPYIIRKLPNQELYRVYNKITKDIYSYGTSLENAKKQVTLLNMVDNDIPIRGGAIILDQALYNRVKREADKIYEKPSAYKSGWIVKTYKSRGGKYADDNQPRNLGRWFKEEWGDIGGEEYPVYRPHKRVSKATPLTAYEIDPVQAKEQIALKQDIKGKANLPPFKSRGGGLYKITPYTKKQAKRLGVQIFPSDNPKKKIEVYDKNGVFITYIGASGYKDYPTYMAERGLEYANKRRQLYKKRHEKDRHEVGSAGYYADQLLW